MENQQKIIELSNWLLNNYGDWLDADDTMMIAHHVYKADESPIEEDLQPKEIEKYFTNLKKRQYDEHGWTGEFTVTAKDILDFIIDLRKTPNQ